MPDDGAAGSLAERILAGEEPAVLDYGESPREGGWSLRSALVRYAQPEPLRASAVLELVRRTDGALHPFRTRRATTPGAADLTTLLEGVLQLDRLGDVLARWALDIRARRPDDAVDAVASEVFTRLETLGVPRETRPARPPH